MRALVWGGSGSGKSEFAEGLAVEAASSCGSLLYIATMAAEDPESRRRIARHRRLRAGKGFTTLEQYTHLEEVTLPPGTTVLLECLSNLVANEMFSSKGRTQDTARIIREGLFRLADQADSLIVVSNDVFEDGACYPGETEAYRQVLAEVNQALADRFSLAVELVHGVPVYWKREPEETLVPGADRGTGLAAGKSEDKTKSRQSREQKEAGAMRLVTGGAYQNKLAFARTLTGAAEPRIWDGAQGEPENWEQVDVLNHFPEMVRWKLRQVLQAAESEGQESENQDLSENRDSNEKARRALEKLLQRIAQENPSLVVITREVGCGLVPMDAWERLWREQVGRLSCRLAEQAAEVYRVCCGLAQKIK